MRGLRDKGWHQLETRAMVLLLQCMEKRRVIIDLAECYLALMLPQATLPAEAKLETAQKLINLAHSSDCEFFCAGEKAFEVKSLQPCLDDGEDIPQSRGIEIELTIVNHTLWTWDCDRIKMQMIEVDRDTSPMNRQSGVVPADENADSSGHIIPQALPVVDLTSPIKSRFSSVQNIASPDQRLATEPGSDGWAGAAALPSVAESIPAAQTDGPKAVAVTESDAWSIRKLSSRHSQLDSAGPVQLPPGESKVVLTSTEQNDRILSPTELTVIVGRLTLCTYDLPECYVIPATVAALMQQGAVTITAAPRASPLLVGVRQMVSVRVAGVPDTCKNLEVRVRVSTGLQLLPEGLQMLSETEALVLPELLTHYQAQSGDNPWFEVPVAVLATARISKDTHQLLEGAAGGGGSGVGDHDDTAESRTSRVGEKIQHEPGSAGDLYRVIKHTVFCAGA